MAALKTKAKNTKRFKQIEGHLKNYRNYIAGIKNLKNQLDYIMPDITASYEIREGSLGAFVFKSSTEDYAIDRIESKRALQLHEDIAIYTLIIESIDNALEELSESEKEFVQLRYFEGYTIEKVAMEMGYSERNLFFLRNKVRDQLMISLKNIIHLQA